MEKIKTRHRALEEENEIAGSKIAALIKHLDLLEQVVLSGQNAAQRRIGETTLELDAEKNRRLVAELTLEHSRRDLANLVSTTVDTGNQKDDIQHNVVRFRRSVA
jgi:hypothetical protein